MYNKNHGRFTSPDEPFFDQYEHNPQIWNLYSYTRNNPLNSIDPTGEAAISAQNDCPQFPNCINETVTVNISKGGLIRKIIEAIFGKSKPKPSPPPQQPKQSWWDTVKGWFKKEDPKPQQQPPPPPPPPPANVPTSPNLSGFNNRLSVQRQRRHLKGSSGNKSYLNSQKDADDVYDAIKNGNATYLGTKSNGDLVYRYNGITGFNNSPGTGHINQPTNVFVLKNSQQSPSIFPTNPNWTP